MRAWLWIPLLAGCSAHYTGLVHPTDRGMELETMDGKHLRLVLPSADARPIAALDGHSLTVDGTQVFRRVYVGDWSVPEGLHGLPTWVGVLEERGAQLGMLDRNSDAYYTIDLDAYARLRPHVGEWVLLEGYVEDARRVRVVYYRVLAPPTDEDASDPEAP